MLFGYSLSLSFGNLFGTNLRIFHYVVFTINTSTHISHIDIHIITCGKILYNLIMYKLKNGLEGIHGN